MSEIQREKDLVLNPNEYAYVLDKTKGIISCVVGSHKMSLSNSDALVVFNKETKEFEEVYTFEDAKSIFVTAPENWYIELKNPVKGSESEHPLCGTSNALPPLQIGKKINIRGNISFALYPGQMAKVIPGHRMYSNQYLLARVYDAESLMQSCQDPAPKKLSQSENKPSEVKGEGVADNAENTPVPENETPEVTYTTGQILVIKGTDTPFYIPPTGIEVIPVGGTGNQYIRDAVTLERLEYCILKNEKGEKKYVYGSAVVFPQPDEKFIENPNAVNAKGSDKYKFKAYELTDISGIYVKVIADYKENGKEHKTGEELFITGKQQMIYYPRPEHAIIDYEGQVVHHAIAIPTGEGRYILDRLKGNIRLVKGPCMYLPDPRTEVVVKRKLSKKECSLWYPGNSEALEYNLKLCNEDEYEDEDDYRDYDDDRKEKGFVNSVSGISRKNKYTKPRTIIINNKYEGAVAINIWTGYAVNVVSRGGTRKVVTGPTTYLMEYDETLEPISLSTGKPKTTDRMIDTVYLRVDNNKISDIINIQTKDFVNASVKVSYCVDFLSEYKNKWFDVENYVKYMTDRERSILKMEAKKHTIEDFYDNATEIVRKALLNLNDEGKGEGRLFAENGMLVKDVEVLSIDIEESIKEIINKHQYDVVKKNLEYANADKELEIAKKLAEAEKEKFAIKKATELYEISQNKELEEKKIKAEDAIKRLKEASLVAEKEAIKALQVVLDEIQKAELERDKKRSSNEVEQQKAKDELSIAKQNAYAESIKKVIDSIGPDLVAAIAAKSNADLLETVTEAMGPYAIARNESVADTTNMLVRGTALEGVLEQLSEMISVKES